MKEYIIGRKINGRNIIVSFLCSLLLSSTSLIGIITEKESELGGISWFFFILSVVLLTITCYCLFELLSNKRKSYVEIGDDSSKISFGRTWIIISACWFPYCIMNFPTRIGGGSINQIKQFYGLDTHARQLSSIIYEGHYVTNHHPVLLTFFYGTFFKIGDALKNTNLVVFVMSCTILLISSLSMSYMLTTIKKYIDKKLYIFTLIFVCIYPIFGIYSYVVCKDNLYVDALIVFYSCILKLIFEQATPFDSRSFRLLFLNISILIPFLKNQGLIIVVLSLCFIFMFVRKIRKWVGMTIGIVILVYVVLFSHLVMPILKIAPGGKQEALSIPFQQTALYVKQYEEELSKEEYEIIDSVLPVNKIASLYDRNCADPVKFTYKQEASATELTKYVFLWVKQFFKHPGIYFKAFFETTDGYYYIGYNVARLDFNPLKMDFTGISVPNRVLDFQAKQDEIWNNIINIPVIGWLFHNAIFSWIMFLTLFYCIYIKQKKWILIILPTLFSFGICLLSPVNGSTRYALPIIYALPIYVCILGNKLGIND